MALFRRRGAEAEDPDPFGPTDPVLAAGAELGRVTADRLLRRMRPKLWARAEIAEHEAVLQLRPLADDLVAVLCLDLPSTVQNLRPEEVATSGLSAEALWTHAVSQLDDGEPVERLPFDEEGHVEIIASDSQFLAARVLELDTLVDGLGPHGALLALPHRHMLMVHRIKDGPALREAVDLLVPLAARAHADGPGSLSPHLYWWHDGVLVRVPVDEKAGTITPPPSFVELLETLSA